MVVVYKNLKKELYRLGGIRRGGVNVILLGAPGAGKGTQAERLVKEFGLKHISTGEIFREEMKNGTELGKKIKGYMDSGNLVPDQIVLETIKGVLANLKDKGFMFDGFPRTVVQAEGLDALIKMLGKKIDFVVFINISDDEVIKRLSARRSCSNCGANYNIALGPKPSKESVCDRCSGVIVTRSDDKEEVIKERLAVYRKSTAPLIEYYSKNASVRFIEINGAKKIEEVFGDIKDSIER